MDGKEIKKKNFLSHRKLSRKLKYANCAKKCEGVWEKQTTGHWARSLSRVIFKDHGQRNKNYRETLRKENSVQTATFCPISQTDQRAYARTNNDRVPDSDIDWRRFRVTNQSDWMLERIYVVNGEGSNVGWADVSQWQNTPKRTKWMRIRKNRKTKL